ncbi:isochorismatase family protein [Streptomyces sp. NPDC001443]
MTSPRAGPQESYTAPHFATPALIAIDVRRGFLSEAPYGVPGTTEIPPALRRTVSAFRAAGRPVVHVVRLHKGSSPSRPPTRADNDRDEGRQEVAALRGGVKT